MRRRKFLTLLGSATAAWPLMARAQQTGELPTIGFLVPGTPLSHGPWFAVLLKRLHELGWIEGRNLAIEYRWAEGHDERYAEIATEFVRLKLDVIVTTGPAVPAAKRATSVIPIVFALSGTRWAPASSRVWHARGATSPAYRSSRPILPASGSKFCVRLSPVCAA
jgi:putative tryptophan/tyrosine transport system substrate-binding protein